MFHCTLFKQYLLDQQILTMQKAGARAIIKVSGHQYRWSAGGYDPEIGRF